MNIDNGMNPALKRLTVLLWIGNWAEFHNKLLFHVQAERASGPKQDSVS
jgi:hypothetical protein